MLNNFLFGISLTASFLAGMMALFAPCCITFLFPSYLGTIFKEQKRVVYYTLIFALGLSLVLIPIALGFRFFIFFFDQFHKEVYYLGSLFLVFMGIMTLKPIFKFPQLFHVSGLENKKINTFSIFGLGFMSGLTSSCCAPVLLAAVTLTSLSPNLLQALIVSFSYVLGIVFPLFVLSLLYQKTTNAISGSFRRKIHDVFTLIGGLIFIIAGVLIGLFTYFNKIQMYQFEGYSQTVRFMVFNVSKLFQNPFIDLSVFIIIILSFYQLIRRNL